VIIQKIIMAQFELHQPTAFSALYHFAIAWMRVWAASISGRLKHQSQTIEILVQVDRPRNDDVSPRQVMGDKGLVIGVQRVCAAGS
jgi:hypothetical protein